MTCPKCSTFQSGDTCKLCETVFKEKKQPKTLKKSTKPIKKVSKKMSSDLREYGKLRKQFLLENPNCQARLMGCQNIAMDLHHKAKRGINYLKIETFMAICRSCHDQIHNAMSNKEAKEKKLLI